MLGLSIHEPHFFILKMKDLNPEGNQCSKCNTVGHTVAECGTRYTQGRVRFSKAAKFQFLKLAVLREYLLLEFKDLKEKLPFLFDFERLVDDFVFLFLLIGNDFLPPFLSL